MEMIAHDPQRAKQLGVPQSVGQDFANADEAEGKTFKANSKKRIAKAMMGKAYG